jgi:anti-anti-sigma factor
VTVGDRPLGGFGVAVEFLNDQAILTVQGDVDILTAPGFGAFFDAVIVRGYPSVVLDLADMDFVGAAGLAVIATAVRRLTAAGGRLTIRSPSDTVIRFLEITGLADQFLLELTRPGRLGPEQLLGTPGDPIGSPARVHGLRRLSSLPADDDVVDGALRLVVSLARTTVGGADGVSVSLRRHGRLSTVAASDQTILDMDADQYATGQGPCVDASVEGHWFHVESLDHEDRWPAFTPRAKKLGINSILSTPLLAQDQPVGALNIYSRTPAAFRPKDQELASVFATEASTILTDAGAGVSDDELAARFQQALQAREVIAMAQGVVMERDGVGRDDAYTVLRRGSQHSDQRLRDRAEDIVASARRPGAQPRTMKDPHD